jgi:Tol biopolymer transport system component
LAPVHWTRRVGDCLGPYEILAPLGAGGMGEVYRAWDPRLRRAVAIKILSASGTPPPERLARFDQEARATGALSHPNVLAVFDVGADAGVPFVVTELLEGHTLRELLRGGPLPPRKAADYAAQIARGLAAAHGRGIIHRDVKPENLFVTDAGLVKLLDFGVAKLFDVPEEAADFAGSEATTGTEPQTQVGTAGYTSPEQARGERVDHRSDIFSLGAVLYEMVAGRRAFDGSSAADRVAAVLHGEPADLAAVTPAVSPSLEHIIARCLEKRPSERFQSAHDLAYALEGTGEGRSRPAAPRKRARWPIVASVGGLLLVAAALLVWLSGGPDRIATPAAGEPQILPLTALPGREDYGSLSPDGTRVAFAWDGGTDNPDIYQMIVTPGGNALQLTSDPAPECCPAWSPDGLEIAFVRLGAAGRGTVLVVPAQGGPTRVVTEVATWIGTSLSWSRDGHSIAVSDRPDSRQPFAVIIVASDGSRRPLTQPGPGIMGDGLQRFSPDGGSLAFARFAVGDIASSVELYTAPEAGGVPRKISREPLFVGGLDWTPDARRIIFTSGDPLRLWSLDVASGSAEPLALGPRGVLADRLGVAASETAGHLGVSLSRAAGRLVFTHTDANDDIWRLPLKGGPREPVAASTMGDNSPQISPDGRRLAFASTRTGHSEIWLANADGTSPMPLTNLRRHSGTPRWSPDGRLIAFDSRPDGTSDISVVDVETLSVRRLTSHPAEDVVPSFSRDGRALYFSSNRDGSWQIYRMPLAGGAAVRITSNGGHAAFESADGMELYFSKLDAPGVWKLPRDGGTERRVAPLRCWGYWDATRSGIYSLSESSPPTLLFTPFGTGPQQTVARLVGSPNCSDWGLSVSRDEAWAFLMEADVQSDLVLVENLR